MLIKKSVYHIKEKFIVKEQYKWNALSITYTIRVSKNAMLRQIVPKPEIYIKFISKTFLK